jgi:DNA-binding HxlR family transcriptional regulator
MTGPGETRHEPRLCDAALSRAFQFLGKRWNGVLLATLVPGPLGFSQLRRAVVGISDSVLSERLNELAAAGLVERSVQDGPPITVSYALTVNGQALTPALHELTTWAAANLPAETCAAHASTPASTPAPAPAQRVGRR